METTAAQQLAMRADHQGESSEELQRYQKMLFGPRSEKTRVVLGKGRDKSPSGDDPERSTDSQSKPVTAALKKPRKKTEKGHGRLAAAAYTGARREKVPLQSLKTGDP